MGGNGSVRRQRIAFLEFLGRTVALARRKPLSRCGNGTSSETSLRPASAPVTPDKQVSSRLRPSNPLILQLNP